MRVTPREKKGLYHDYEIVVAAKDIEAQMEQELQNIGRKAKIPGFRPGKIPLNILRQKYGKDVMGDVITNSVDRAARDLMSKEKLRPALQPEMKVTSYEEGGDLTFTLAFEVLPDVPEIDFSGFTLEKLIVAIDDSEIDESLDRLAKQRKHPHSCDAGTKAEMGHVVKIDFLGKKDGTPFAGGEAKGFQLELGSNQFIPGFEEQLVGLVAGDEKVISVTFPKDYHSKDLAGAECTFDIKVHEVMWMHTPDIDDKLATSYGFENLKAIREAVRRQIEADYAGVARSKAKKQLFDLLDTQVKFDVPQGMYKLELDNIMQQLEEAKKANDPSVAGKSDDDLKKEYEGIAERRVRLGIVLADVGRRNNLIITKEELSRAINEQARMFPGQEQKVFEFYKNNPKQVDELRGPILEEKAVDWILERTKRVEKQISREELLQAEMDEAPADGQPAKKAKKK